MKRKKMHMIIATLLVTLLIMPSVSASKTTKKTLEDLESIYDMEIIDPQDVPDNVVPTELDSIEELEEILQQQDTVVTEIVELTPINKEATTIESNLVAPMGLPAIYQYNVYRTKQISNSSDLKLSVGFQFDRYYSDAAMSWLIYNLDYYNIYETYSLNTTYEVAYKKFTDKITYFQLDLTYRVYGYQNLAGQTVKYLKRTVEHSSRHTAQ